MSREALDRFIEVALRTDSSETSRCDIKSHTEPEDAMMGLCLESVGVTAGDSRDKEGKGRFFPFSPQSLIPLKPELPSWYWDYMYYPSKKVRIP